MKRIIYVIIMLTFLYGNDYYSDKLLIYIENAVTTVQLDNKTDLNRSSLPSLNRLLEYYQVEEFRPWLRQARPQDHDGDIYLNHIYLLKLPQSRSDIYQAVVDFENNEYIVYAEQLPIMSVSYIPDDPRYSQQWFLPNIQAPEAWNLWDIDGGDIPGSLPNQVIKVGIIDDGVDWDHSDLVGNIWNNLGEDADNDGVTIEYSNNSWVLDPGDLNGIDDDGDGYTDNLIGWDVAASSAGSEDNDPTPVTGDTHGTLVSGATSGVTNNGTGIAAVGWSVKIMPIKSSYTSNGYIDYGYEGILAAAQAGADVINCSWGGYGYSSSTQSLINVIHNQYGSIIVAAAGNGNENTGQTNLDVHYPSGYDNVISVTATGSGDRFNCWATAGTTIDLSAPGENIMTSNVNNGYLSVDGTSFSAPITAGAIGLLWSRFPDEAQSWIENQIISTTDYFDDMDRNCNVRNNDETQSHSVSMTGLLGSGRLNIFKALAGGIYPSLAIQEINLQGDTDGDGIFNPGETINIKVVIRNEEGWATATDVVAFLATDDQRITMLDSIIEFQNDITAGTSTFTLFDAFRISAAEDAVPGTINLTITMQAGQDPYQYNIEEDVSIDLSLTQEYFPYLTLHGVKTSPVVYDLDNDGENEIYFGSDDFNVYAVSPIAEDIPGFPFSTRNQVRSSIAIGNLDNDDDTELVFGSKDKNLYVINADGSQDLAYLADGYIIHTPVLADLDGDEDLEIIFGTFETGAQQGGKVYAIHHDGTDVINFPLDIGEIIFAAPAVGDIDQNDELDIVVGTWSNNIYAISAGGVIKDGFPFTTGNRINIAPSLANLTGGDELEIAAASDDGILYILSYDGTSLTQLNIGTLVRGGASFHDADGDGYPEVIFGGYDNKIHMYNVITGTEVTGWPVSVGQHILSSAAIADLNNDGTPEIISATSGSLVAYNLDGTITTNFPISTSGSIVSSPAIQDLDNDGDFEILIGTSNGIEVIDIKSQKGSTPTWRFYRGSFHRTGFYKDAILALSDDRELSGIPAEFRVGDNYPNPFNPKTVVKIAIPETGMLEASIYNILGQKIVTLENRTVNPGYYSIEWSGQDQFGNSVASGVYILAIQVGDYFHSQKMLLVK